MATTSTRPKTNHDALKSDVSALTRTIGKLAKELLGDRREKANGAPGTARDRASDLADTLRDKAVDGKDALVDRVREKAADLIVQLQRADRKTLTPSVHFP